MSNLTQLFAKLPAERQESLRQIAQVLFRTGWRVDGGKGTPPTLDALSERNQRRWIGAALACESLMAQAKNDDAHQTACINMCIDALTKLRDENASVTIA